MPSRSLWSFILLLICFITPVLAFPQDPNQPKIRIDTISAQHIQNHPSDSNQNIANITPEKYYPNTQSEKRSKLRRDSTEVRYFSNNFEKLGKLVLIPNDTAIDEFENYDPLFKISRFFATLGNIGQNYRSLEPDPFSMKTGFDYGIHSFDHYLFRNDSVRYYKVFKTYSELFFVQGAKKEQNFRAVFSRNIYRSLNLGFDFRVATAPGAYTRQKTNHINFVLTSQFFTKNKRYGAIANFSVNRLINFENGGIKSDSLFVNDIESKRAVIPVNLTSAQNLVRESGFFMKHYFDITRSGSMLPDTTEEDHNIDLGRLSYSFQYSRQVQNFTDPTLDRSVYPNPLIDSLATNDSVVIKQFLNTLVWSNPSYKPGQQLRIFQMEAGIKQSFSTVDLKGARQSFIQFIPYANVSINPWESIRITGHADYVIGTYNESDFSLEARLMTILGRKNKNAGIINATAAITGRQPGWFYSHYSGNFSNWDTTWKQSGMIHLGFSYSLKFFDAGVSLTRYTNFIYLDSTCSPRQFADQFALLKVYFNPHFEFWRFRLKAKLIYQLPEGTTIIRLPVFMGSASLYFSQSLFGGAAFLQPGVDLFYNTSYYADAYNPAIRSFYLQDKKEIGNYLYMDIFINLKIQRARFFVTYTHFNAGFMGRSYYMTPGYPMPDAAFKFGVAWRFHD